MGGKKALKTISLILFSTLTICIAGFSPIPVSADSATVSLSGPSFVLENGQFNVKVNVSHVTSIVGYDVIATYDASVLEPTGVTQGLIDGTTVVPLDDWGLAEPDTPGAIRFFGHYSQGSETENATGAGYLADMQFRSIGTVGQSSNITLTFVEIRKTPVDLVDVTVPVITLVAIVARPAVVLTTTAPTPTNLNPVPVTATFDKAVTGFSSADLVVNNGAASAVSGGPSVYTFNVTPLGQGLITVDMPADSAIDGEGNGNKAALQLSLVYDSVSPSVTLASASPNPTGESPIPVAVTFNENVAGFTISDITVGNGSAANLEGTGAAYTFNVIPVDQGLVTVDIGAGVVQDIAGNNNLAATRLSRTFDSQAPVISGIAITAADGTYSIGAVINFSVVFSKNVTVSVSGNTPPAIHLNSGGLAVYSGGSGTKTLTFSYTVGAGESSTDLDYSSASALDFRGGSIWDTALNVANVILPTPSTLAAAHDIVIDTVLPEIASISPANGLQLTTIDVVITGSHLSGATVHFSGSGITINSLSVNEEGTQIQANISIAFKAVGGLRDVWVTTSAGTSNILGQAFKIRLRGDASGDNNVNVMDVIVTEMMMLGQIPENPEADANNDGYISIGDVLYIELIILGRV